MSNAQEKTIITKEGFKKIQAELEERKGKSRTEIANKLEAATEQGDLSENAAYKSALEEKELNESKIQELEEILANSVIQEQQNKAGVVTIGRNVKVERVDSKETLEFSLVGKSEADPMKNMISIESPVGKAVYHQNKGETVDVNLPSGTVKYTILEIK